MSDFFNVSLCVLVQKRHEQRDGGVSITKRVGPAIAAILMAQIFLDVFFAGEVRLGQFF
jgi:hypothetical protein